MAVAKVHFHDKSQGLWLEQFACPLAVLLFDKGFLTQTRLHSHVVMCSILKTFLGEQQSDTKSL